MRITIIAAVARNGVIGYQGRIPWHLPADLAHFKRTTTGHTLVMGRRTFESTGALPGRRTLVLTRDPEWKPESAGEGRGVQVEVARSLEEAIDRALNLGETELFICGGEKVYRQALRLADRMVLTRVEAEPGGDTHFPEPDWSRWRLQSREKNPPDSQNLYANSIEVYQARRRRYPGNLAEMSIGNIGRIVRDVEASLMSIDHRELVRAFERSQNLVAPALGEVVIDVERQQEQLQKIELELASGIEIDRRNKESGLLHLSQRLELNQRSLETSIAQLSEGIALQAELIEPHFEEMRRAYSERERLATSFTGQLAATGEVLAGIESWVGDAFRLSQVASEAALEFRSLVEVSAAPVFGYIASQFRRTISDREEYAAFQLGFASSVLDYVGRIQRIDEEGDEDDLIEELETFLGDTILKVPKTTISLEGITQALLALVLFALSYIMNARTENRMAQRFLSLEERVMSQIKEIEEDRSQAQLYVVAKAVRLRKGPSTQEDILAVLQPNMVVEVRRTSGRWLFVDYFDFVSSEQKQGWVYKRFLRAIER